MMNRFLLAFAGCIALFTALVTVSFGEDFFNDQWYNQRRETEARDTRQTIDGRRIGEPRTEEGAVPGPYVNLYPSGHIVKATVTITDSVDVEKGVVRHRREIPGIEIERYYYIPIDEFILKNLEFNRNRVWNKEREKRMKEWQATEKGGLTNLDLVIPVGKRFERLVGGTANINIDGSQRIEFSGRSEYDEGVIATATNTNNKFPSLTMKQEPKFTIRGNIGERLKIDIKQDTQAGTFANIGDNISIKYQGKENDIIKNVEAGNISLSLPGATFAGYSGTHQGLFGIRTESRLGPIELTTIASQEKSESTTKTFRGSAEESSTQIRDYQYKANTYFFLDFFYRDQFAQSRDDFSRILYDPADSVSVIEVYINDGNSMNDSDEATLAYPGVAWPMDMYTGAQDSSASARVEGYYHRLDPSQYYISRELGYIQFNNRINDSWTVGVYMKTKGDSLRSIEGKTFGSLSYDATRPAETKNVFKLIKRKSQRPTDTATWDLEWKNVYDLGQRNIDLSGLEIKVYLEATDGVSRDKQDGIPYLQILGLDRVDETGSPTSSPDNKVDFNRGLVDRYRGELIFPLLRPFDAPLPPAGVSTELKTKVPQIYDSANQSERVEATRYYIEVKTSQRQSTMHIEAGMFGLIENSETITLNGRRLNRGTDYRIDYTSGTITFLIDEATSPNAQIEVSAQPAGAAPEKQKTLFGVRGEYDLWSESRLGAVFLFNNESTKEKRVRLGNEPSRTMLFDVDADLNFEPKFLTTAVDMLPGVVANTPSKVRLQGEYAHSMPNMNTHGEVYIDDFEGSSDTPVSIMRTGWYMASPPSSSTAAGEKIRSRGIFQWYNPWDRIDSRDIWPNKETAVEENTVHVLNLAYGASEVPGVSADESFAGITTSFFTGSGIDLSRSRFLEVWARGSKGTLKIDLGSISEDAFPLVQPNGVLDTEDTPIPGLGQGDGILTAEEDTGLDRLFNKNEPGYGTNNRDPNGDDFGYNENKKDDYSRINGTEGNASDSDRMGIPDTEDINRNGILDTSNRYYEYSINLSDQFDPYLVVDTVPDGNPGGWRLFRIPLWNNEQAVGDGTDDPPDSTLIENARLWITGADTSLIQIAEMKITESRWLEQGIFDEEGKIISYTDEVVQVTTKSVHENFDYKSPPGIKGELDRDSKIRQNEQSIVLGVENLSPGNTGFIYRTFEKMDLTDYTSLKLFVHGPDDFPSAITGESDYEFIVRFGADKNNFYEYRTPVYQGWAAENNVEVDFATCTSLKLMEEYGFNQKEYAASLLDSLGTLMSGSRAQIVADSLAAVMAAAIADSVYLVKGTKTYYIHGNPSLNNVRVVQFGLRNNQDIGSLDTEIWLDELRMDDLRNMDGTASRLSLETDFSGFMQIRGKLQQQTDDFHGMNTNKGSGKTDTSWNSGVKINLDRFTPRRWNLNLSISGDLSESEALPRLMSGSDIILPDDEKYRFRTYSSQRSTRFSYKKGHDETLKGISGFVTRWAFEKASVDYDWGEQNSTDPASGERDVNNQQVQFRYDVAPRAKGFVLLGWFPVLPTGLGRAISNAKFNYTPSALNYSYKYNERNTYVTDIDGNIEKPLFVKTSNDIMNFSYDPFSAINYDFMLNRQNDLYLEKEVSYVEDNKLSLAIPEFFYITNKYSYNIKYDEDNDPKYSLSSQLGSRTIMFTKGITANADIALNRMIEERFSGRPRQVVPRPDQQDQKRPTWGSLFDFLGGDKKDGVGGTQADSTGAGAERKAPGGQPRTQPDGKKDVAPDTNPVNKPSAQSETADRTEQSAEKTEAEGKKTGQESRRTRMVMVVSKSLSPLTLEYRQDEQLNYAGVTSRPDFMTRLGQGSIPPPDSASVVSSRNTSSQRKSYNASTRITLPLDIGIRTSAKFNRDERLTSSVSEKNEDATVPDITVSMTRVEEKIVVLKRFVSNMSLNSTFSVTSGKSYQNNSIRPTSDRMEAKFSPLFSMNAKVLKKYDLAFALNTSNEDNKSLSGDVVSASVTDELSTVTTVKYRITASEGIPFLKELKLKSDIDLTGEYRTSASQTERAVGRERAALIRDDTEGSFSLIGNYTFSQKLRGGMEMQFKSAENITKKIHKIREVKIWCELRF
jgi:hypothetical protein